jgi:hypothetical protein
VLFWDRRVYWGVVLLVVTALRQGRLEGFTVNRIQKLFTVTRPTLSRWLRYFREHFPQTRTWRRLCGRLLPPVRSEALVGDVLERFVKARDSPERGLMACLVALRVEPR